MTAIDHKNSNTSTGRRPLLDEGGTPLTEPDCVMKEVTIGQETTSDNPPPDHTLWVEVYSHQGPIRKGFGRALRSLGLSSLVNAQDVANAIRSSIGQGLPILTIEEGKTRPVSKSLRLSNGSRFVIVDGNPAFPWDPGQE